VISEGSFGRVEVEEPLLWLGMAGFAPAQRAFLEDAVSRANGAARWRICGFGEADAWWVNGANVRVLPGGNLKVAAGIPTERALNLDLTEVDRPVAFASPQATADFEPRCSFDPASEPSIHGALLQLEHWLRPLRAQFVLGKQIIERGADLRHGVYHVSYSGKLLAVLDFHESKAAISPEAHPVDLWEAQWKRRPMLARDLPPKFSRSTPAQLAWIYARHTERDLLPLRYRTETVYYRGVPQVPVGWLRDSQLMLLRELAAEPGDLAALGRRTGLPPETIAHDLACLYFAGGITATAGKAGKTLMGSGAADSLPAGSVPNSVPADSRPGLTDLTAPARLELRPRAGRGNGPVN
jgi:hypothetical protein